MANYNSSRCTPRKRRITSQEVPSGTFVPSNRDNSALWTFNRSRARDLPNEGLFPGDESIEIERTNGDTDEESALEEGTKDEDEAGEAEEEEGVESILLQQSDLTERILAAEKRFSTSSSSLRNFLRFSSAEPSFLKKSNRIFESGTSVSASFNDSIKHESDVDDVDVDDDEEEEDEEEEEEENDDGSRSNIKTSAHAYPYDKYFNHPIHYRVLFMGSIRPGKKEDLLKKLTQGLIYILRNTKQNRTLSEAKYNIAFLNDPLDSIITQQQSDLIPVISSPSPPQQKESFFLKDMGVSLIEADFTWSSFKPAASSGVEKNKDGEEQKMAELRYLLLRYAWQQCPHPTDLPATVYLKDLLATAPACTTTLTIRPEKTPNGIDLVIYIYDGQPPTAGAEIDDKRVRKELEVLCILRKFGIYVLPLTVFRDERIKKHFAQLLTHYKVRCLDLSNLDVGQTPSFKRTSFDTTMAGGNRDDSTSKRRKSKDELELSQLDRLSKLQKMECLQFNEPRVATYQILTVDQFCAIDDGAIFELLKRTRERHVFLKEEEYLSKLQQQKGKGKGRMNSSSSSSSNSRYGKPSIRKRKVGLKDAEKVSGSQINESMRQHQTKQPPKRNPAHIRFKHGWYVDCYQFSKAMTFFICCGILLYYASHLIREFYHWTAQFEMIQFPCEPNGFGIQSSVLCNEKQPLFQFVVATRNPKGELSWASTAPQVYILHDRQEQQQQQQQQQQQESIPIQKIHDIPGYYLLDFNSSLQTTTNRLTSFTFTVNKHRRFGQIYYTAIPSDQTAFKIYIDDTMIESKQQSKNKQKRIVKEQPTIFPVQRKQAQQDDDVQEKEQNSDNVSLQDIINSVVFYKNNFIRAFKSAIFVRN